MADINEALPPLYRNEGLYANHPRDTGGETYRGISRNNWSSWKGWELVDQHKKTTTKVPELNALLVKDEKLNQLVKEFYQVNFWEANKLDEIRAQSVADKLLDMAVNMGSYRAGKILQQALVHDFRCQINIDGKIGRETIGAVNRQGAGYLLAALRKRSVEFYEGIVESKPDQRVFLNNWLKRAEQ